MSIPKKLVQDAFALLGLKVSRLAGGKPSGSDKYFNTGQLTPLEENSKELYDTFYGDHQALEEYYQGYRIEFYSQVSRCVRENGVVLDGKRLLDVGCGTGHLLSELKSWSNPKCMDGCDFSDAAMQYSKAKFPGCHFFVQDITQPIPGQYDVVCCTEVIEHIERPFIALQNLMRVVAPGGCLIVTVPNGRKDTSNEHINFWSPESWKVFLERECPSCAIKTTTLMDGRINFGLIRLPA
ncbi:MAG: class I SAM-dependent methyltransferase [Prosthecobacter sp.]|uniref:class I SAM-dependent methyltransferase n=1 Tax=Prosthecobacter sp. TaxID=1965333 RepID=UPI0038FF1323